MDMPPHGLPAAASPVDAVLGTLRAMGSEANRAGMGRYGITTERAFGVSMKMLEPIARGLGHDHALARALWQSGFDEARLLAVMVEEPDKVTEAQMDRWAGAIDSWDLCDQACSRLFVKTPFVDAAIGRWADDDREFVRRAGFALLVAKTVHDKRARDKTFVPYLATIEQYATDNRNFVRKAVNWALRQIGKRSRALHGPALAVARRLAASDNATARWIGKDAVRELTDPIQVERIARRK
jgi:3-methyladenine DNA glycosylase AlkD